MGHTNFLPTNALKCSLRAKVTKNKIITFINFLEKMWSMLILYMNWPHEISELAWALEFIVGHNNRII